jgi:hypothetical protein
VLQTKASLPVGQGEILVRPAFSQWAGFLQANREVAATWDFLVAGRTAAHVRALARREALGAAEVFSARLGVEVDSPGSSDQPIIATGHQPELFHPGVWMKAFLLQRFADESGATALDVVVDSDGFDTLDVSSPCMRPDIRRCTQYLAVGSRDSCYACSSVPSEGELREWVRAVQEQLQSLPAPVVRDNFTEFSSVLASARADSRNLAEFVTISRRRFEASADTRYLELPVTRMGRSEAFAAFVVEIAHDAARFHGAYNGALGAYRAINKTRSAAQPFPDLARVGERFELPLWSVAAHGRDSVWCERAGGEVLLLGDDGRNIVTLSAQPEEAIATLVSSKVTLAPKALAMTLFVRAFVCDLFIHGVGGGNYDRVTDDVFTRYFGVQAPAFVVASATMHLPLGMPVVTDAEVAAARERLNRVTHNPDALLGEVAFDSDSQRERASELAAEKAKLVSAIAAPDADKKAMGARIRELNAELGEVLAPFRDSVVRELALAESQRIASEVLTDRTYALCFWSPLDMAQRARQADE